MSAEMKSEIDLDAWVAEYRASQERSRPTNRDLTLCRHFLEVWKTHPLIHDDEDALVLALLHTASDMGHPGDIEIDTDRIAMLVARSSLGDSDDDADHERITQVRSTIAAIEQELASAQERRAAHASSIEAVDRVASDYATKVTAIETEIEGLTRQSTSKKKRELPGALEEARIDLRDARREADVVRTAKTAEIRAVDTELAAIERRLSDASDERRRINLACAHRHLAARGERDREDLQIAAAYREQYETAIRQQSARFGGLVQMGLESPAPPGPQKHAVSIAWPRQPSFTQSSPTLMTDEEIATVARLTGLQIIRYDQVIEPAARGGLTSAQMFGLAPKPPPQPPAPRVEKVYPSRLSDDAADRLAAYLATIGDETTITADLCVDGSSQLFHTVRPPSCNELRALAKLPPLRREDLPLGHADDQPSGWAHTGPILERLEQALAQDGLIAKKRATAPGPTLGQGVRTMADGVPQNLDPEVGRAYRLKCEGKSPQPQRAVRFDGREVIVERS